MNTGDDKLLFEQLYRRYITVADKYFGGYCTFSALLALWAYYQGDASLKSVLMVAGIPFYNVLISQLLKYYPHLSGFRGEIIFRIFPNTFVAPYVFFNLDASLTPWLGIYLCMTMSSVVVMGYGFAKPHIAYAISIYWAINMLIGSLIFTHTVNHYQIAFLASAILMVGLSSAEWIHQARTTITREINQSAELKLLVQKLQETEVKLKESLETEASVRQKLEEGQHLLEQAQHVSKIGYTILYAQTGVREWSPELKKLLRFPLGVEIPSFDKAMSRVHPDDLEGMQQRFNLAIKHGISFEARYRIQAFDDEWLTFQSVIEVDKDAQGKVSKIFTVVQDISDQVRNDQLIEEQKAQLLASSKLSALGQMASGIAHEINTPLGAIMLNAKLLNKRNAEKTEPDSEVQKRSEAITTISQRIAKIIQGLKHFSRSSDGEDWHNVPVEALVEETLDLCRERFRQHGIELLIKRPEESLSFRGDAVQASQVLLNLLTNAFDAIQGRDEKWVEISWQGWGKTVEIAVTDCGLGIAPSVVENMFNPFYTTKGLGDGMGLGLSISMGIMKKHNGELLYDRGSEHTRFIMVFPRYGSHLEEESV